MPPGMMELCHQQWKASCLKVRISQLHKEVAESLRESGFHQLKMEQLTSDELFSIDIALQGDSNRPELCSLSKYQALDCLQNFLCVRPQTKSIILKVPAMRLQTACCRY